MARVLLTAGPTREPIDPVRYLSNASSGRTGLAIAREALRRGHTIDLVLGPIEAAPPDGANVVRVITAREMLDACRRLHPHAEIVIGAAAVCDFRPARILTEKVQRTAEGWTLDLEPNADILADLGGAKGPRVHIGFALEAAPSLEAAASRAAQKLVSKRLDWIIVNLPEALGRPDGSYLALGAGGEKADWGRLAKEEMAARLFDMAEKTLKLAPGFSDKPRRE